MTITLDLTPSEEARLRAMAALQGKEAEACAADLLKRDLGMPEAPSSGKYTMTDFVEAAKRDGITLIPQGTPEWREALQSLGRPLGFSLSIEATSRENIYDDEIE